MKTKRAVKVDPKIRSYRIGLYQYHRIDAGSHVFILSQRHDGDGQPVETIETYALDRNGLECFQGNATAQHFARLRPCFAWQPRA